MANRDFINMQPISNSDMVCETCGHLYDPIFRVCTCMKPEEYREFGIEDAKQPIRRIMPYKDYVKEKFGGK
jgi:hypothetical protein